VLPAIADRAAIYAEVADRLAADAEQGDKDGLTRIYRRSAARKVRDWAAEQATSGPGGVAGETSQPETQADGWHLTPQTLDLFVRALVNEVDYDIHKNYECGEEDGEDHYPELVSDAAEMLDAITAEQPAAVSQPGKGA
jgi:hypothetical protein